MANRLVVVSNRVADPRKTAAGGLAVALGDALATSGGLWFGWSGRVDDSTDATTVEGRNEVRTQKAGNVSLATVDLSAADHEAYYLGYSNGVLWPVFHYRLDLADFEAGYIDGYRRVNRMFAHKLLPLLQDDDVIWVQDYHLIPLAAELRALGCKQRIGFFLHVPLPPAQILSAIPAHEWLMRALFAYDLVGVQSRGDLTNLHNYLESEVPAKVGADGRLLAYGRSLRAESFPIGIDVDEFIEVGKGSEARELYERMRKEFDGRQLLVGVDRLDYSKGLPHRIRAMRHLLERYPDNHGKATLVQVASPSREDVEAYSSIRRELEGLCGALNGDYSTMDWTPVRYIHRTIARKRLPGLFRAGRVALVTPLRDGMNLVAKEFIASQNPEDPGVLVLSRFAGAAEEFNDALLVNPYDTQATAEAIQAALNMPVEERRIRHQHMLKQIRKFDVHWWRKKFLETLMES